jgi:hypothetical protein
MSTFRERPDELTDELRQAGERLMAGVSGAASERGLERLEWRLAYGRRSSGGQAGVPEIAQWGFQVAGYDRATGERRPLHCFLDEETVLENVELAERIIGLWLDRVETGG